MDEQERSRVRLKVIKLWSREKLEYEYNLVCELNWDRSAKLNKIEDIINDDE